MTLAGKKILAGAAEALEVARGQRSAFEVWPKIGCKFCAVGLKPVKLKRQYIHHIPKEGRLVVCKNAMLKPS